MSRLLQHYASAQAQRRPDAPAVRLGDEALTYGELDRVSDALAGALREVGCRRGDRVGLLLEKSPRAVAAVLGVLKADCIYVPVDVGNPPARLVSVLSPTEPAALLCDRTGIAALRPALPLLASQRFALGWMERTDAPEDLGPPAVALDRLTAANSAAPSTRNRQDDVAYILFTSGSTGTPKGVPVTHASVRHFTDWAVRYLALGPDDRLSGHSQLHFDLSMFDVFGSFAAGGELHLVPPQLNLEPSGLAAFLRDSGLTEWFSVPSVLTLLAKSDVVRHGDFPALRQLLWCGEVFPTPALQYWMRRLPHVRFTNLYGPTETTIASSYYTIPSCPESATEAVPIGRACPGEQLLVLGSDLERLPPGVIGDLYIGGAGLSPGYWRDEALTRAAFRRHPATRERLYRTGDLARLGEDGLVYFVGRADSQIKSRGYRIELGEIEAALVALGAVAESAVVAVDSDGFEGKAICCAYAARPGAPVEPWRIRRDLAATLPAYMLPSRWLALERLPRNANGKIDRPELRRRFERRAAPAL